MIKKNVIKNTIMLYGLSIAKIVFPLVTLPYLTRVLTTDAYGTVAYVKSIMQYMQILIDFGFMLSGTKDIVNIRESNKNIGRVTGEILGARIILAAIAFIALVILTFFIDLLSDNKAYTYLSFVTVFLSIFLFDYLFRGLEKMEIITIRFIVMRGIATVLTFVFVHDDADILWIPVLDIIGSFLAVVLVIREIRKLNVRIEFPKLSAMISKLKDSAVYFISNMATTAFGALNTVLIGIFLPPSDVAYWSVSMQLISAVQIMYNPITDGVFPEMVKSKDLGIIKRIAKLIMPVVVAGCIFTLVAAKYILLIVGGQQYIAAAGTFRLLVPVLLFSFPGMLIGWPTLGAIDRAKEVTTTTIISALFQGMGLCILGFAHMFSLYNLAILRSTTELVLFALRFAYVLYYKKEYAEG